MWVADAHDLLLAYGSPKPTVKRGVAVVSNNKQPTGGTTIRGKSPNGWSDDQEIV